MPHAVRTALVQAAWAGDTEAMTAKYEEHGDNDFYGSGCFVDGRGRFVGDVASGQEELLARDLGFTATEEARRQWAFHRDRRPDAFGDPALP